MTSLKLLILATFACNCIAQALVSISQNGTTAARFRGISSRSATGSTYERISDCALTLIACTSTTLHLNVPASEIGNDSTWKGWFRSGVASILPRLKWTAIMTLAPEIVSGLAFSEFIDAQKAARMLQSHGRGDIRNWCLTQIYFANMGGHVFEFRETSEEGLDDEIRNTVQQTQSTVVI